MSPVMWKIVLVFAVVTRSEAKEDLPVTFHFSDLKVLTDMFQDCDTLIVSDGGSPHNLYEVSQPIKVYNEWREFEKLGMTKFGMTGIKTEYAVKHYDQKSQILRDELTVRNCKAQILVYYRSTKLSSTTGLKTGSAFRVDEMTFCYTVIIHKDDFYIKRWMFSPYISYVTIPHYYHVSIACQDENGFDRSSSSVANPIAEHYRGWTTCHLDTFSLACLYCIADDVLEWSFNDPLRMPLEIARGSRRHGSISANEYWLALAYDHEYVVVQGLILEAAFFQIYNPTIIEGFQESIQSLQANFGRHAVVTKLSAFILPEALFLHSVLTHHANITVKIKGTDSRRSELTSREVINGPGLTVGLFYAGHFLPVGTAGISFMTCSNISLVRQSGIFSAPFDGNTWIWTVTSVVAVSIALLMAMKKMSVGAALFLLMYTMVRLLLDNHSDVSKDLVKRGGLMASLTFLMALATIILSNGYKGVLTSDFSVAPIPIGGSTFEQVLDSNWTVARHVSPSITKKQQAGDKFRAENKLRILVVLKVWIDSAKMWSNIADFQYTGPANQEYQLVSAAFNLEHGITSVNDKCHCNGSYWLFETGTFWPSVLPRECDTTSRTRPFFLSTERIANRIVSWSSTAMRPGPVFRSIHRGIEAGLYNWLNKVRRFSNTGGVTIKDNMMTRVLKKEPKPLSMKTALVLSTFRLHVVLSLITVAALVGEFLWKHRKRIYFKVMWWIDVLNHGGIMAIVEEFYRAYFDE